MQKKNNSLKRWLHFFYQCLIIEKLGRGVYPLGRNWKRGLVIKFTSGKLGRGVYPLGRNWKSGLVTKFTSVKLGRGVYHLGRNWKSRLVTKFTSEKLGRGVLPEIRKSFDRFTRILYFLTAVAVGNSFWKCTKFFFFTHLWKQRNNTKSKAKKIKSSNCKKRENLILTLQKITIC